MKHLKIVSKGFETYTGNLGGIDFVDGMSAHPVPRVFANRLTAAMQMVEVDENGVEIEAGVAARLITEAAARAPVIEPLQRQTEEEKIAENVDVASQATVSDVTFHTREELEAILEKDGIKGLRAVAEPWKVKDRSAVKLMEMILEAQARYTDQRNARIAALAAEAPVVVVEEPEQAAGETEDAAVVDPKPESASADPAKDAE